MKLQFENSHLEFASSLSAVARVGNDLWLGGDEGTLTLCFREGVEKTENLVFSKVAELELVAELGLPGTTLDEDGKLPEVDLEGMDWDAEGGYLWMVGSHSLKRKAARHDKKESKNLERLADISADGNRFLLARLPLQVNDGISQAVSAADQSPAHFAARLDCSGTSSSLLDALRQDPLISPFLAAGIPGKDNGVDIEGLAWDRVGKRLLVGMRGPVLRGMALILEVQVEEHFVAAGVASRLDLLPIGPDGRLYRRHFLDLDGLSIRDLCFQNDDLLILAGPTMPIDWPVSIYRWRSARDRMDGRERFVWQEDGHLTLAVQQPLPNSAKKHDRPEALCLLDDEKILVICDSPSSPRLDGSLLSTDEIMLPKM